MVHILFTHGYFLREDPKEQVIMKPYPPLGLLYLSAFLEKNGWHNEVFDTTFSEKKALFAYILKEKPRILALYTNLMTKLNILEIIAWVRTQTALNHTQIVVGGPDVTHNVEGYLGAGAQILVLGEGEQTMLELAEVLVGQDKVSDEDLTGITGIAFRSGEVVLKTAAREKIRDINELPFPNRLKINYQAYLDAWENAHGQSTVSISTQRGCPYTCKWCSTAVYGQSYRRRSAEHVVEEIIWLREHYDFDLIWFVDDVFTISHKWLAEFQAALVQRALKIQFECITRADRLTDDVVDMLKSMGCFRVWIGAESGSQRIIQAMDRRVEVQQVQHMIQSARRAGIQAGTFIMLGYPGETEADIQETVAHLKISNPDLFTITVAYPIRGTGLYEQVETDLKTLPDWQTSTDRDLDFRRTYPRRYYDFAVRWTVNAVHLHKAQLAGQGWGLRGLTLRGKVGAARAGMWASRLGILDRLKI
jgi:anaerobic magnesium-protoporphyrin IX monomethyl ester cyclase